MYRKDCSWSLVQEQRIDYEQQLIQVMNQFGVSEEFQLVTGCIVQWDKMNRRRNGKRFDTRAHVLEAIKALQSKYLRSAPGTIVQSDGHHQQSRCFSIVFLH
jgi:hypothetical protein